VLAVAAARYGILVHAWCVMSNHYHLVVTDPLGKLPDFSRFLDAFVARAINTVLGRREAVWAPSSYCAVRLLTPEDVVEKVAYVLANPVRAGLVPNGNRWPGLWSSPDWIGGPARDFCRPAVFFRPDGPMPAQASLALTVPTGFERADEFRAALNVRLRAKEMEFAEVMAAEGRTFVGRERVLRQKPTDHPTTDATHRQLRPRIACWDPTKRREALKELADFLRSYRDAWRRFVEGFENVVFPAGTYRLRVTFRVPCTAPV
jgi:REP element-mobilizing transposase RayT